MSVTDRQDYYGNTALCTIVHRVVKRLTKDAYKLKLPVWHLYRLIVCMYVCMYVCPSGMGPAYSGPIR